MVKDQLDACVIGGRYRVQISSSSGWWGGGGSEVADLNVCEHACFGLGSPWEKDFDPRSEVGDGLAMACGSFLEVVCGVDSGMGFVL